MIIFHILRKVNLIILEKIDEVEKTCGEENNEAIVETLSTLKDIFGGEKCCVALLPKLPVKHPAIGAQRLVNTDLKTNTGTHSTRRLLLDFLTPSALIA